MFAINGFLDSQWMLTEMVHTLAVALAFAHIALDVAVGVQPASTSPINFIGLADFR